MVQNESISLLFKRIIYDTYTHMLAYVKIISGRFFANYITQSVFFSNFITPYMSCTKISFIDLTQEEYT